MTSPAVRFACEPLTESLWNEALPLLHKHWEEIAHYSDIPLDPDRPVYEASQDAGILRVFTARDDSTDDASYVSDATFTRRVKPLLGYAIFFVRPSPHYKGSVQAAQDVLYLDKSVRGGTGYKFIAWCDDQLRAEGVQAVYHHVKAAHDFGKLLERQGYELVDKIFAKRLDGRYETQREGFVKQVGSLPPLNEVIVNTYDPDLGNRNTFVDRAKTADEECADYDVARGAVL